MVPFHSNTGARLGCNRDTIQCAIPDRFLAHRDKRNRTVINDSQQKGLTRRTNEYSAFSEAATEFRLASKCMAQPRCARKERYDGTKPHLF